MENTDVIMSSALLSRIVSLRHTLHAHAELSMHEFHTKRILMDFIEKNTSLEIVDMGSWFYCVRPGDSYSIAFRADMDALPIPETIKLDYSSEDPDVSHKCGHDGHMAVLCALAILLDRHEQVCSSGRGKAFYVNKDAGTDLFSDNSVKDSSRSVNRGLYTDTEGKCSVGTGHTVYLIFQPGEETGQGGKMCAALIKEKGIREVYAFHNLGGFPEGSVVLREGLTQPASEGFTIRFTGKCSHASAPELGRNPSAALAKTALYADSLTGKGGRGISHFIGNEKMIEYAEESSNSSGSLENGKDDFLRICTIVHMKSGERNFGISAGDGQLDVTLRAEYEADMKEMENNLREKALEYADEYGLGTEFEISDYFPETKNDSFCLGKVREAAAQSGLDVIDMPDIWRASEDFGYYTLNCPGAMFYIGTGENHPPLHTPEYDFDDSIIPTAASVFLKLSGDI